VGPLAFHRVGKHEPVGRVLLLGVEAAVGSRERVLRVTEVAIRMATVARSGAELEMDVRDADRVARRAHEADRLTALHRVTRLHENFL